MPVMEISEARFGFGVTVSQDVLIVAFGVGITDCWECGGDGDWTKFHPEPHLFPEGIGCVNCKGTGKQYVDAWGPVGSNMELEVPEEYDG